MVVAPLKIVGDCSLCRYAGRKRGHPFRTFQLAREPSLRGAGDTVAWGKALCERSTVDGKTVPVEELGRTHRLPTEVEFSVNVVLYERTIMSGE